MPHAVDAIVSETYRSEWGRVLATIIRLTNNFDLAEEAAQEAFAAALDRWRDDGVPEHPRAWLIQTARHLALDRIRRKKVLAGKLVDALEGGGELDAYHLLHAARADFARRLGDFAGAARSYRRALELVGNDSERRFLERRLREVE